MGEIQDIQAKFGLNGDLKPAVFFKVKREVGSYKGKFNVQFAIAKVCDNKLLALLDGDSKKLLAFCEPLMAVDWLKGAIAEKGYESNLFYYTDIEQIEPYVYAFDCPADAKQWIEVPVAEFRQMLEVLSQ